MITGTTQVYGILADPIAQVRTPQVLNAYFQSQGMDAVLVPMQVSVQDLAVAVQGLRKLRSLAGFIVTVPHKTAMAGLCDALGPAGQAIGAVNTVRREADGRLVGDMFDGAGFVQGLRTQGKDPAGQRILLLGAGGAASAIAFSLVQAGAASLAVANRTRSRAEAVLGRVRQAFPQAQLQVGSPDARGFDMVVNATSLGMREQDPLPLDIHTLNPATTVAEVIMKPEETALLVAARQLGCPIHHGRHMLDQQIQLMAGFMRGDA